MSGGRERGKTPWLELAIGGSGALIVLSMVGYLLYDAVGRGGEKPVDIVLEQGPFVEQTAGWRASVVVHNLGDRPAEAVELRAELQTGDGEVEEATLTLAFLPPRGSVEGAFLFEGDPNGGDLRLLAVGYLDP